LPFHDIFAHSSEPAPVVHFPDRYTPVILDDEFNIAMPGKLIRYRHHSGGSIGNG